MRVTGGTRLGMMTARANWRAVCTAQACSMAPSRRWTCQSSGRRIVIEWGRGIMRFLRLLPGGLQC